MSQLIFLYLLTSLLVTIVYEIKMEIIKEYKKNNKEDELYLAFGKDKEKYFNCMYVFFPSILLVKIYSFLTKRLIH